MTVRTRWLILLTLLSSSILSACGGSAPTAPAAQAPASSATNAPASSSATNAPAAASGTLNRDPKTLVVAFNESADNLDPAQAYNVANNVVSRGLYEGLVRLKGSSLTEVEPVLAESFTSNADKSVWTFKIRQGVKFHDGSTCDAQAIYDSMMRGVNLKGPTYNILGRFLGDKPTEVMKVVDPSTLEFRFSQPQPQFILAMSSAYGTGVVSPKAVKDNAKGDDLAKEWFTNHAVGTGAYKLDKFAPNDEFVLVRNPDYWRGWNDANKFEKIVIKIAPESSTRRQMIEKGDADIDAIASADDLEAMQKSGQFNIGNEGLLRIDYAAFNIHGKLKDPRVRQAISYAFDYDGYINGIRKGQGQQPIGPFPRNLVTHDPNAFTYKTDLEKAKSLLKEAGWVDGTEVTFTYYPGFYGEDFGPVLQAQLEQVGIKLKIEERNIADFNGIFYGDQPPEQRPDIFWYAWWPDYNDPYNWSWVLYHSGAAGSRGANAGFYKNDRVDQLINESINVTDQAKLNEMYKEVQNIITEKDPAGIWAEDSVDHTIFRKDIAGQVYNAVYSKTFDFYALSRQS